MTIVTNINHIDLCTATGKVHVLTTYIVIIIVIRQGLTKHSKHTDICTLLIKTENIFMHCTNYNHISTIVDTYNMHMQALTVVELTSDLLSSFFSSTIEGYSAHTPHIIIVQMERYNNATGDVCVCVCVCVCVIHLQYTWYGLCLYFRYPR